MGHYSKNCPPLAGHVLFTCGDATASVSLAQIDVAGCRLPHAGIAEEGRPIVLAFLDGVSVSGVVESLQGAQMRVAFDRPVSRALVEYFAPTTRPSVERSTLADVFGRRMPPLPGTR